MSIYQYYKQTNNKSIYNKKIAYNILLSTCDLNFANSEAYYNYISNKVNNLQGLHKFCDKQKILNHILTNCKSYKGQIVTSFAELDKIIL